MKDCLIIGMALGFLVGAVLVQSNKDVQKLIKKGKETAQKKIQEIASEQQDKAQD